MHSEILDLVDENDNVIGQKDRDEIYAEGLSNIRVVNGFIMNSKGQLWIPRRTANKRLFPDALDVSIGGHIGSGEDYESAFKRETAEELNIDLNHTPFKEIAYLNSKDHGVHCFQKVYLIETDEVPKYNPSDFSGYYWLKPEEVLKRISSGDKVKDDLPILIKLLFID